MTEKEKLFSEFPPISTQEWEEKIQKDLKGADYERKLVWRSLEGFKLKPYHREEDISALKYQESLPGNSPYMRGTEVAKDWVIRQDIPVNEPAEANKKALKILNKGAGAIGFIFDRELSYIEFETLLKGIHLEAISIHFINWEDTGAYTDLLAKYVKDKGLDPQKISGSENYDPYGFVTIRGYYPCHHKECQCAEDILSKAMASLPEFRPILVNARHFQNAGANISQELGMGMSMAVQYLDHLTDSGFKVDEIAPRMQFVFATGSNYFMEIAKYRAARLLWARIIEAYGSTHEKSQKIRMHAETTTWNMTVYDPYVNMLRSTTEAMSAVIGGVDSLNVQPFDKVYAESNDFSERIARNLQLILKEEAHLNKVQDASAGSYYIETLTDKLIDEAWNLFNEIEEAGGYLAAFKDGIIQKKVSQVAEERLKRLNTGKDTLVGTNKYPNYEERIEEGIQLDEIFSAEPKSASIGTPLRIYRASELFEALRITTDQSAKTPRVFLLPVGNKAMRSARAQFAGNFFAVAGFQIITNIGFDSLREGMDAALEAKADVIVLCSSDEEYEKLGVEAAQKLGNKKILAIAGNPACRAALEENGIQHFIHVKSNILQSLSEFQKELGIS